MAIVSSEFIDKVQQKIKYLPRDETAVASIYNVMLKMAKSFLAENMRLIKSDAEQRRLYDIYRNQFEENTDHIQELLIRIWGANEAIGVNDFSVRVNDMRSDLFWIILESD